MPKCEDLSSSCFRPSFSTNRSNSDLEIGPGQTNLADAIRNFKSCQSGGSEREREREREGGREREGERGGESVSFDQRLSNLLKVAM